MLEDVGDRGVRCGEAMVSRETWFSFSTDGKVRKRIPGRLERRMIQNGFCSQVLGRDMNSQHVRRSLAFEANATVGIRRASQFDIVQVFLMQGRAFGGPGKRSMLDHTIFL